MAPPTTTTAFQKLFQDHKLKAEKTQFWWKDQQINGMCNNLTVNIFTMAHLQKETYLYRQFLLKKFKLNITKLHPCPL